MLRNELRPAAAIPHRLTFREAMTAVLTSTMRAGRVLRLLGWVTLIVGLFVVFGLPAGGSVRSAIGASSAQLLLGFGSYGATCLFVGAALKREEPWATFAGAGVSFVSLAYFPFGTLLGAATLVYLLRGWRDSPES
jgi:hypothetical protein